MGFDIGRAFAGAAVGVGDTYISQMQAERADALKWADEQRRAGLAEAAAISADKRLSAREDARDEKKIAAEERKADLEVSAYQDDNDVPYTKGDLKKAIEAKKKGLIADAQAQAAGEGVEMVNKFEPGAKGELDKALNQSADLGFGTQTKPSIINSAKPIYSGDEEKDSAAGKGVSIVSTKKVEKAEERAAKELESERARQQRSDDVKLTNDTRKEVAEIAADARRDSKKDRDKTMTDNQRQVVAKNTRASMAKVTTIEDANNINNERAMADLDPLPIPEALKKEKEASDKKTSDKAALKTYLDKRTFGDAIVDNLPFTPSAKEKAAKSSAPASVLPKGSTVVPGKFTKDGRQVYKTADGTLIAPK